MNDMIIFPIHSCGSALGNTALGTVFLDIGGQNPHPREISRSERVVFPNASLLSAVYGFGYNTNIVLKGFTG